MQKSNFILTVLRSSRGSVLVGVVAFTIIMAIAGAGYLATTGTTVNNEIAALYNDKAFFAAESGLLIGTRWLRVPDNFDAISATEDDSTHIYNTSEIDDDMIVNVAILNIGGDIIVHSEAEEVEGNVLKYRKVLRWAVLQSGYDVGTFIDDLGPFGNVGQGGLNNTWFDGPFHSNTPIYLSAVSNPTANGAGVKFVNGPATVYNKTEEVNFADGGHWGNFGALNNDYEFGIHKVTLNENTYQADKLDPYFENSFKHTQDSLFMSDIETPTITLNPSLSPTKQPFLVFSVDAGVGKATYHYFDAGGSQQTQGPFEVDQEVIKATNNIQVLGEVKGQVTLYTEPGFDILPVGDLTYDGFNPSDEEDYITYDNSNNYGVETEDNNNILALVSGGNIFFEQTKMKFNDGTNTLVATNIKDQFLYLNASLFAYQEGKGLWWVTKNGRIEINKYDYSLRAIGSRTIDTWFSYDAGGKEANEKIRFFFDSRLSDGLQAPGVPDVLVVDGNYLLKILSGTWTEENIPI